MTNLIWEKIAVVDTSPALDQQTLDVAGAEPEYLYRDDLAYGQLAIEIAKGALDDDADFDLPPLDGWLSDM